MATLNLTTEGFADIAMIWLFDQVMNPEQVDSEPLKEFIQAHGSKIKTPLMKYYLDTTSEPRVRYKRIKGVFDGSDKTVQQIRIGPSDKIEKINKGKQGIVKKVINKLLKKEELTVEDEALLQEIRDVDLTIYLEGDESKGKD
jgi:hypothetical protein